MSMIQTLVKEMEQEAQTTRKMLSLVPAGRFDWAPHEKNMKMKQLALHIAELPSWVSMALSTDELDFADNPYTLPQVSTTAEVMEIFEKSLADGKDQLEQAREYHLNKIWTLRNKEEIYSRTPVSEVIRMTYCQIVHHRAQLGVYLRLLDIPIPGSYGPSADDPNF